MAPFRTQVKDQFTFAIGENGEHLSSTWMARCNLKNFGTHSEPELFLFNLDAGHNAGKLSFHCSTQSGDDPQVFMRHHDAEGKQVTSGQWDWPDPLPGRAQVTRLAAIILPSSGLSPSHVRETSLTPTFLEPPPAGAQIEIDVFAQPEPFDIQEWPGKTSMDTKHLGQFVYYDQDSGDARFRFIFVSRVSEENLQVASMTTDGITLAIGSDSKLERMQSWDSPRAVCLLHPTLDGQKVPVFAEIAVGPVRSDSYGDAPPHRLA